MIRLIFASFIVIVIAGCSRNKDDTADLNPTLLTQEQRRSFDLEGLRPGMPLAQAFQIMRKRHPNVEAGYRPNDSFASFKYPNNEVVVWLNSDLIEKPINKIELKREYPNGARAPSLSKALSQKYGELREPSPYINEGGWFAEPKVPKNVYFAGEGISSDGTVLRRCLREEVLSDHPTKDCGTMVQINFHPVKNVVEDIAIALIDARVSAEQKRRVEKARDQAETSAAESAFNQAEAVNSF